MGIAEYILVFVGLLVILAYAVMANRNDNVNKKFDRLEKYIGEGEEEVENLKEVVWQIRKAIGLKEEKIYNDPFSAIIQYQSDEIKSVENSIKHIENYLGVDLEITNAKEKYIRNPNKKGWGKKSEPNKKKGLNKGLENF